MEPWTQYVATAPFSHNLDDPIPSYGEDLGISWGEVDMFEVYWFGLEAPLVTVDTSLVFGVTAIRPNNNMRITTAARSPGKAC